MKTEQANNIKGCVILRMDHGKTRPKIARYKSRIMPLKFFLSINWIAN